MASFTYTIWSDSSLPELEGQLRLIFEQLNFTLINPRTGKIHFWSDCENVVDPTSLRSFSDIEFPIGVQWWRGEDDDIYTSIDESSEVGGLLCCVSFVGFSREEQAEIARLLILHVAPEKRNFPEDFDVFRLSAE